MYIYLMDIENFYDCDWIDFVDKMIENPPGEPFSFRLQFLDEIDENKLIKLLSTMLIRCAKYKYNKELYQLSNDDIDVIKEYLSLIHI